MLVPVGVGSLAAAAARFGARHGLSVIGVEPVTAACLTASLAEGRPVVIDTPGSSMAGLDCAEVSSAAWQSLRSGIRGTVTVDDDAAAAAVAEFEDLGLSIGHSRRRDPCRGAVACRTPGRRRAQDGDRRLARLPGPPDRDRRPHRPPARRMTPIRQPPCAARSTFRGWRSRLVAGAGEDRLSGVLGGDGVVAAEEVELTAAAVDVVDEGAGRAQGRRSIGHRGAGWLLAGLESGWCGSARSFRVRRRSSRSWDWSIRWWGCRMSVVGRPR